MDSLLPCPFCGGQAALSGASGGRYVECLECKAEGAYGDFSDEQAIAAWNRRADTLEVPEPYRVEHIDDEGDGYYARLRNIKTGEAKEGTGATIAEAVRKAVEAIDSRA